MKNKVKAKIEAGEKVIGTFSSLGGMSTIECLGQAGLDYVIIDAEHSTVNDETMTDMIRISELSGLTPFIRIADVTHGQIQHALDSGAGGLIVPCLETAQQVKKLVNLSKFSPKGNRGFAPCRGSRWGCDEDARISMEHYMNNCNEEAMIIPQCETREFLEHIEEIVKIEGVDGIFIGPFDLSISLGIPAQFENPMFIAAVERILKACMEAQKPVLIYAGNVGAVKKYFEQGFAGAAYGMDAIIYTDTYKKIVKDIRG